MTENNAAQPGLTDDNVKLDINGATWLGMRVAGWTWEEDAFSPDQSPSENTMRHYASHWSTGPHNAERLYRESDIAALLSKLRAEGVQAGDEREAFEAAVHAEYGVSAPSMLLRDADGDYVTMNTEWVFWLRRAALASAPVAGEAQRPAGRILYSGKGNQTIFRTYHGADIPKGWHDVYLSPLNAAPQASEAVRPELAVWYGSMPESNGKSNWTAILHRKGDGLMDGPHITIDRSEYPDRVRYEADRLRFLIGEIDKEPWILDYDADKCDAPQADKDGGDCAKGAGDERDTGKDRLAFHIWALVRGMDITLNDSCGYQSPLTQRAWMRWNPTESAALPTPSVVKQSLTATQTGEKGESDE